MEHPLITTISYVGHWVEGELNQSLHCIGLSITKLNALHHIHNYNEPIPLSEIADQKGCVKSNITQLIDRMVAEGLVERTRSENDRRKVLASLTPKGKQARQEGMKLLKETENKILSRFSEQEKTKLTKLLQLIGEE